LFAFVTLFTTASFAGTKREKTKLLSKKVSAEQIELLKKSTCKVTESWTNSDGSTATMTITITCDCTTQQACDKAHAIISIVVPD